jgi:hypothetical protein
MSKRTTKAQKPTTASQDTTLSEDFEEVIKNGGYIVALDRVFPNVKEAKKAVKILDKLTEGGAFKHFQLNMEVK